MLEPIFDFQFRLILVGDTTVGKSSLLTYFSHGTFLDISEPTVGVDFFARLVQLPNGTRIKLQLWDTAGQERFRSITKAYYRNSVGVLLTFDITNRRSFEAISTWLTEARRHIDPIKPVFLLLGCKKDLKDMREVSVDEAKSLASSLNMQYVETSAKTGENIEEAFQIISQDICNKIISGEYNADDELFEGIKSGTGHINFANIPEAMPQKSKCC